MSNCRAGPRPKRQDIDAAVGFARQGIYRTAETGSGPMPRHLKLAGSGFDSDDDLLSDLAMDVAFGFHNLLLSCRHRGVAHGREKGGWQRGAPHRRAVALAEEGLALAVLRASAKKTGRERAKARWRRPRSARNPRDNGVRGEWQVSCVGSGEGAYGAGGAVLAARGTEPLRRTRLLKRLR